MQHTRAPRCFNFRRHPYPIHAQRRGFAYINGRSVRQWVCPSCGNRFFKDI